MQLVWRGLEAWVGFKNDVVLVQLRVHRVDLTLAEGVVQGAVDGGGRYAKARGRGAVDDDGFSLAAELLIGDDICELGKLFELFDETIDGAIELGLAGVFQRVLILRAADAVIHRKVLHWLHVELDAFHLLQLRPQTIDDVRRRSVAVFERLQVDLNTAAVHRRIHAIGADER